jgi:hypothetical protein
LQHAIEGCARQSIQSTFAIKYEISERKAHGITLKVREVLGTHFAPNEFRSPSDFISMANSRAFIKKRLSESGVSQHLQDAESCDGTHAVISVGHTIQSAR